MAKFGPVRRAGRQRMTSANSGQNGTFQQTQVNHTPAQDPFNWHALAISEMEAEATESELSAIGFSKIMSTNSNWALDSTLQYNFAIPLCDTYRNYTVVLFSFAVYYDALPQK